jgi:hypothetical protein
MFCMSEWGGSIVRTFQHLIRTRVVVLVTYVAHCVRTALVIHPNGEPYRIISLSPLCRTTLLSFSLAFGRLCIIFLSFSHAFLTCSCAFVIYLHPRYVSPPFFMFLFSFYA